MYIVEQQKEIEIIIVFGPLVWTNCLSRFFFVCFLSVLGTVRQVISCVTQAALHS